MKSDTAKYYDANAKRWAVKKVNSFFHEKQFHIFESLLKKGDHVIDIGCAYGIHVPLFLGIGHKLKYSGIDVSKAMIRLAMSRYPQVDFQIADAATFKSTRRYDAFWSAATLMHVFEKDWSALLANIERNVKSHGIGYVTLPSDRPNSASIEDKRHFEIFDKKRFKAIAEKRGWKIIKSGTLPSTTNSSWYWYIVRLP